MNNIETFVKHVNLDQINEIRSVYHDAVTRLNSVNSFRPIQHDVAYAKGYVDAMEHICQIANFTLK